MRVRVDQARSHPFSGSVEDLGPLRDRNILADRCDLAVVDEQRTVFNRTVGDGQQLAVCNSYHCMSPNLYELIVS